MQYRWKIPLLSRAIYHIWKMDAQRKFKWVEDWIERDHSIVEIGSGPGSILEVFRSYGHNVTGLDIADNSIRPDLTADIYDGVIMPYDDNQFDISLLLTMLHHCPDPVSIIGEAMRISNRLIIIEDVYDNAWQAAYTKFTDSMTNMEFIGHPHSNRNDEEWQQLFKELELKLIHHQIYPLAKFYQQAVYILDI